MSFEEQCNSLAGRKLEWMKPVADYLKTRNDIREKQKREVLRYT